MGKETEIVYHASENLAAANLARVIGLARLRRDQDEELNDLGKMLPNRSLFSAYVDCIQSGIGEKATETLKSLGIQPKDGVLDVKFREIKPTDIPADQFPRQLRLSL